MWVIWDDSKRVVFWLLNLIIKDDFLFHLGKNQKMFVRYLFFERDSFADVLGFFIYVEIYIMKSAPSTLFIRTWVSKLQTDVCQR